MALEFTRDQVERIVKAFWGEPNKALSKKKNELRFGTHGSRSVDLDTGRWYDHENNIGGYPFSLIKHEISGTDRDAFQWLEREGIKSGEHYNGHINDGGGNEIQHNPVKDPFVGIVFKKEKKFRIVKTWPYVDETGAELFEVCRLENGEIADDGKPYKTYRQRHKDPAVPGQYIDNIKGIRQVPYKLREIIKAVEQGKTIFITEGERCADAIAAFGGMATTNAMGAGKWPDELTPFFKNADIVVLPDNDEPGGKHAALVLEKLKGVAKRARILRLPGLPQKGDVADWIKEGGTLEQLRALADGDGDTKSVNAIDGPLPLFPPLPDAEQYPVNALGPTLSRAAKAIASKVQVPVAKAAQSVLATA